MINSIYTFSYVILIYNLLLMVWVKMFIGYN